MVLEESAGVAHIEVALAVVVCRKDHNSLVVFAGSQNELSHVLHGDCEVAEG